MKRRLAVASAFLVMVAGFAIVFGTAVASADPATIIRSDTAGFFDGNGNVIFLTDASVQFVETNNADGTTNIRAQATLPAGSVLPSKAQHNDFASTGFTCGGSTDWSGITTPSGQVSFTCHLH